MHSPNTAFMASADASATPRTERYFPGRLCLRHAAAMDPLEGVSSLDAEGPDDIRGPTRVHVWTTVRGARITVSLPRERPLTQQIRDWAEDHAHRTLDDTGEARGGFSFNLSFPEESRPTVK
jgi:hypothetical protein